MSLTEVLQVQESTTGNKRKFNECEITSKKCKTETTNANGMNIDDDDNGEEITDDNDIVSKHQFSETNDSNPCDKEEMQCPKYGQIVNRRHFRRAGNFVFTLLIISTFGELCEFFYFTY